MPNAARPPSAGHGRSGSVAGEELLAEGHVARESGVVTGLLNSRYARLFPSRLATFRRQGDEVPSKTWPIVRGIELSPVEAFEYRVRHAGASTLWAVTTHAYDKRQMWSFVVSWPASGILGQERLCLAFADAGEARRWHDALARAVASAVDDGVGWGTWAAGARRAADGSWPGLAGPGRIDSETSESYGPPIPEGGGPRHRRGASYPIDFKVNSAKANAANAQAFGLGTSPAGSPTAGDAPAGGAAAAKGHLLAPAVAGVRIKSDGHLAGAPDAASRSSGSGSPCTPASPVPRSTAASRDDAPLPAALSRDGLRHRAARHGAGPEGASDAVADGSAAANDGSDRRHPNARHPPEPAARSPLRSPHEAAATSPFAPPPRASGRRRRRGAAVGSRSPSPHRLPAEDGRSAFEGAAHSPSEPPSRAWQAVHYVNGTSIFVEAGDEALGGGGALLASAVVRAAPEDVFRRLVAPRASDDVGLLWGARTVERIDAHASVVAQRVSFGGLAGAVCAPRELVLLRTARRDRDGTCIVLFQSVEPDREIDWEGGGGFGPSKARLRRSQSAGAQSRDADALRARGRDLRREAAFGRAGHGVGAVPASPGVSSTPFASAELPADTFGLQRRARPRDEVALGDSLSASLPPDAVLPSPYGPLLERVPLPLRDPSAWWYSPVRMRVDAAGFTVAPLLPRYRTDGESRECLLTLVIKADAGGALARNSRARRWLAPLLTRAMLEAFSTSLVTLRERVEQDRFVVRPLALEEDSAAADERHEGRRARGAAGDARRAAVGPGTALSFPRIDETLADEDRARAAFAEASAAESDGGATLTPAVARRTASRVAFDGNSLLELQMAAARRLQARASMRRAASMTPSGARTPAGAKHGGWRTPGEAPAPAESSSFAGASTRAFASTSRLREPGAAGRGVRTASPLGEAPSPTSSLSIPGAGSPSRVHLRLDLSEVERSGEAPTPEGPAGSGAGVAGASPATPADAYLTPSAQADEAADTARWMPTLSPLEESKARAGGFGAAGGEASGKGAAVGGAAPARGAAAAAAAAVAIEVVSERAAVAEDAGPAGVAAVAAESEVGAATATAGGEAPPSSEGAPKGATPTGEAPPSPTSALSQHDSETEETETLEDAWAVPGTLRSEFWSCPGESTFKIRGPTYLTDRVKVSAGEPVFELVAVDLLKLDDPVRHVARFLPSVRCSPAPFLFVLQLMVPSSPPVSLSVTWASPVPIVADGGAGAEEEDAAACEVRVGDLAAALGGAGRPCSPGFARLLLDFFSGDGPEADARRNRTLKLIPRIVKGSWIIKKAVGNTPSLLGQKLATHYYRGRTSGGGAYVEVDVDLGSSSVAASITNMVLGATRSLTIDLGVLVEATDVDALPEHLLGTIRLDALDARTATYLDDSTGRLVPPEV